MTPAVRFGLTVPQHIGDAALLRAVAQAAERNGFDSLWVVDHLYHYPTPDDVAVLEAFTVLGLLAGWTNSVRLGTLVLCNAYRPPALTAKIAASLDVLSGGRLELGYGAGWHAEEHAGYGYDFPPPATRIAMMEEGLEVIKRLWSGGPVSFAGKYYRLDNARCEPKPLQQPRPPLTIGGGGEQLLLRAVARHADVWNYFPVPLLEYERKLGVLTNHCRAIGRDPSSLRQSLVVPLATAAWEKEVRDQLERAAPRGAMWRQGGFLVQGTPDIVVPRLRDYARRGVSLFIVVLPDSTDVKQIEFVASAVVREFD